jgi:endonuclease YncB( thermonuclease family)
MVSWLGSITIADRTLSNLSLRLPFNSRSSYGHERSAGKPIPFPFAHGCVRTAMSRDQPPRRLMIAAAAILGLIASAQPVRAQVYSGPVVTIQDGDTFTIRDAAGDFRVRLCGVDSPERGHQGYQRAKDALTALIGGKTVRCVQVGSGTPCDNRSPRKSRDRIVAQCFLESKDISDKMVCSGSAVDWQKFSGGYYRPPIPEKRCK